MGLLEGRRFDRIRYLIADDRHGMCYVAEDEGDKRMSIVVNNRQTEVWEKISHFRLPYGFTDGRPLYIGRREGKTLLTED